MIDANTIEDCTSDQYNSQSNELTIQLIKYENQENITILILNNTRHIHFRMQTNIHYILK